ERHRVARARARGRARDRLASGRGRARARRAVSERARDRSPACPGSSPLVDCGVAPLSPSMRTLAVLASGQGTNFEALVQGERRGELGGHVTLLASDQAQAPALERARRLGVEAVALPAGARWRSRLEDERPWIDALRTRGVDTVLLAGFMRRLHAPFLTAFEGRILNIHPS